MRWELDQMTRYKQTSKRIQPNRSEEHETQAENKKLLNIKISMLMDVRNKTHHDLFLVCPKFFFREFASTWKKGQNRHISAFGLLYFSRNRNLVMKFRKGQFLTNSVASCVLQLLKLNVDCQRFYRNFKMRPKYFDLGQYILLR